MTEDIVQSMSLNKILVALLEEYGTLTVPTTKFVDAANEDKELVVKYDDTNFTFKFSLRGKMNSNEIVTEYGLDALAAVLHETAREKGFWDGEYNHDKIGNKLALVHSEVTEVLEAIRKSRVVS